MVGTPVKALECHGEKCQLVRKAVAKKQIYSLFIQTIPTVPSRV